MNKILFIAMMATLALADIGRVTVVKGDASVERDVKILKAHNEMGLLKQDIVETAQGRLQMYFNDKTVISLGRESRFVIKEYLYEENSEQVAATFKLEKGFVKTITGAIGKIMPDLFVLETSTTKMTPHGTIWSAEVNDESEIYKVLEGRVTLVYNDGLDRKVELLAGETALLKKAKDGSVKSFKKSKITNSDMRSRYENSLEQNLAIVNEEKDRNLIRDTIPSNTGETVNDPIDEGDVIEEEVHDNRDGEKTPKG